MELKAEVAKAIRAKVETIDRLLEVMKCSPGKATQAFIHGILAQEQQHLEALCSSLTRISREEMGILIDAVPTTAGPTLTVPAEVQALLEIVKEKGAVATIGPVSTPVGGGATKTLEPAPAGAAVEAAGVAQAIQPDAAAGTDKADTADGQGSAATAATVAPVAGGPSETESYPPAGWPSYQLGKVLKTSRRRR